jgi:putative tricarboxylic transport membrane protein
VRRALLLAALIAQTHPVHASQSGGMAILAPAAPGGGWDQTARALQRAFAEVEPGTAVQVDNIAGAAGTIGLARFVRAERGNPSALMVTGLVMLSGIVTSRSPVSLDDCIPIARLTGEFEVIVVPESSPFRRLEDLVAAFRADPGSVSWGGGSAGGTDDLLVRLLAERVSVAPARVNYIAFSGGGAVLPALVGGQVTAGVSGYTEFAGQIQAGQLRVLAVSAPARVDGIDAPTLREAGIDLELQNWRAVMAPPGLSDAERDALTARVRAVAASGAWRHTLKQFGWADLFLAGPEFRQFLMAEQSRVEAVLRRLSDGSPAAAPPIGPHLFPTAALAGLVVLTLGVAVPRRASRLAAPDRGVLILLAALFVQPLALPLLGFVFSTTLLFTLVARLMGSRRLAMDAAIGFALAAALFVAFGRGLGVALPRSPLPGGFL